MKSAGLPEGAIRHKMIADGFAAMEIDTFLSSLVAESSITTATVGPPAFFLQTLPATAAALQEPYYYLSVRQAHICRKNTALSAVADYLPGYVPHRIVADALGFSHAGIQKAVASLQGSSYVWATEFENVHTLWSFEEPALAIGGKTYRDSEHFYHCQKPRPFNAKSWESRKIGVMIKGLRYKFAASQEARALLAATYPHTLLSIKTDRCWGFHPMHGGENMLARLLMEIRDEMCAWPGLQKQPQTQVSEYERTLSGGATEELVDSTTIVSLVR